MKLSVNRLNEIKIIYLVQRLLDLQVEKTTLQFFKGYSAVKTLKERVSWNLKLILPWFEHR